jgi:hypothetical protein
VFAFELSQSEGDFAQLSVTLWNRRAGFLRPDRKQWAWFSARLPDESVAPLFMKPREARKVIVLTSQIPHAWNQGEA